MASPTLQRHNFTNPNRHFPQIEHKPPETQELTLNPNQFEQK
ncbi:hypothetical protein CCACVL1_00497, partial [Corchorus capsularis]